MATCPTIPYAVALASRSSTTTQEQVPLLWSSSLVPPFECYEHSFSSLTCRVYQDKVVLVDESKEQISYRNVMPLWIHNITKANIYILINKLLFLTLIKSYVPIQVGTGAYLINIRVRLMVYLINVYIWPLVKQSVVIDIMRIVSLPAVKCLNI